MNDARERSDFKSALNILVQDMERETSALASNTYQGAEEPGVLEHVTRRLFLDGLLVELGWSLGVRGNVAEEARVRANTTLFIDYLGVRADVRTPLLIMEAKAWDVPMISASGRPTDSEIDLLVLTLEHLKAGGARDESPSTVAWYDFLRQIWRYVHELKSRLNHDVPRVVLTSGQWLVIFVTPTKTFLDDAPVDEGQIVLFKKDEYVRQSDRILDLLAHRRLAGDAESFLRPSQLGGYIDHSTLSAVFHGIHLRYEATGSTKFAPKPRILVYPVVILLRADGVLILAIEDSEFALDERESEISDHLLKVNEAAQSLLGRCSDALGVDLAASEIDQFPGFPPRPRLLPAPFPKMKIVVHDLPEAQEWVLVTGQSTHYLRESPELECRFHEWSACRLEGNECGPSAISFRVAKSPRSFFTDGQPHHCAHQLLLDTRDPLCHIAGIDSRTCCQSCIYSAICWQDYDLSRLPCGR